MNNNIDVNRIYNQFVKKNHNNDYLNRYVPLPVHLNNKSWKWEGKDFPRVIALLEFKRYMEKYNLNFNDVLSFNGATDPEYEYLRCDNKHDYHYEDDKVNYDLHSLNLDKKDFDFVMLNQTLEHLYNPILALENVYKHLKQDGIFYANVPANNIPHSEPFHYYTGFTAVGLGALLEIAGFNILEIGQWGNRKYLNVLFNKGWTDYKYDRQPGINEVKCPIIVWILAQKKD